MGLTDHRSCGSFFDLSVGYNSGKVFMSQRWLCYIAEYP